jgi:hypothetical protein
MITTTKGNKIALQYIPRLESLQNRNEIVVKNRVIFENKRPGKIAPDNFRIDSRMAEGTADRS